MDQPQHEASLSLRLLSCFFKFARTPWYMLPAPGLSRTETGILIGIEQSTLRGKPLRISDLSHIMRVSSPTITQHINNLENQGFVKRTQAKEDKRAVNLALSEKGHEALRQHRDVMDKNFDELVEYLGPCSAETLISLLDKTSDFFFEKDKTYLNENRL
jgi:DNA-binding MarR family transcriptional regulator